MSLSMIRVFILLAIILGCVLSTKPEADGLKTVDDTISKCTVQMQQYLLADNLDKLQNMLLNSGKGINKLGLYDTCNDMDGYIYTVLAVRMREGNFALVTLGICAPSYCDQVENYQSITEQLDAVASGLFPKMDVYTSVEFPSQILESGLDAKAWIVVIGIIMLLLMWIGGIIVQYTSLFDKPGKSQEELEALKPEQRKATPGLLLLAFSPANNIQKLFTVSHRGDQTLAVLNGVRVLSIGWVILGHSFSFCQLMPVTNINTVSNLFHDNFFAIIPGGVFAVDVFFYLSGLLTAYLLTAKMYPKRGSLNFFMAYFHRYYRLIFPYLFVEAFTVCLIRYLGDGPVYRQTWDALNKPCDTWWWSNFLFINNLVPWDMSKNCIGWVWYLANDFQFFLITPPILYVFCKNRIVGYILVYFLLLVNFLYNGIVAGVYNVDVNGQSDEINAGNWMYSKPWSRMGAYLVGIIFGLSYFELTCKEKFPELRNTTFNKIYASLKTSRILSIIVFLVGFGLTALYVFPLRNYMIDCNGENCWNIFPSTLYNMTCRPFFVLGVGLVIAPVFVGRLRFIKNFLGSDIFAVLARLNYIVYMIHCIVLFNILCDTRQPLYVNSLNQWFLAVGVVVLSFLFAVPVTMLCEVPFMNLEKWVLFPPPSKGAQQKKAQDFEQLKPLMPKEDDSYENGHNKTLDSKS